MQCPRHGLRRPTFNCQHLQHGKGLWFNQPDEPPNPEFPFKNAWCEQCDQLLQKEGEWNDRSEKMKVFWPYVKVALRRLNNGMRVLDKLI